MGHGRPDPLGADKPNKLAKTIVQSKLKQLAITCVLRDDLRDGAAGHEARTGSDHPFTFSLNLLKKFKALFPHVPTKSGIMVGLGETDEEILEVMRDMRAHNIEMLTIGQYLAPSGHHLPVRRYVHPDTFKMFEAEAYKMGFTHAAVGAMVRSSYHADQQASGVLSPGGKP